MFSQKALEDAKASIDVDADKTAKAERTLKGWGVPVTEDSVRQFFALRMLKGPGSNITKKLWEKHETRTEDRTEVSVTWHLVLRKDLPVLPACAVGKAVDPRSIPNFPKSLKPEDCWVLPKSVPVAILGDNVQKLKRSAALVSTLPLSEYNPVGSAAGSGTEQNQSDDLEKEETPDLAPKPQDKSKCILNRHASNPDKDEDVNWAEKQALNTEKFFAAEKLTTQMPDSTYVIHWVRSFKENVDCIQKAAQAQEKAAQFPVNCRAFLSFVTEELMKRRSLHCLPDFVAEFKCVKDVAPELVSPLCDTLIRLAQSNNAKTEEKTNFSLAPLSEWPVRKAKFEECTLWRQFEEERDEAALQDIKKNVSEERKARLQRLIDIYPKIPSGQSKDEATIIKMILQHPSNEDTLVFLLEEPKRCAVLKEWFPGDGRCGFEVLSRPAVDLQGVAAKEFTLKAQIAFKSERATKAVKNPVVQLLLKEWRQLSSIAVDKTFERERDELLARFFEDLFVLKLGLSRDGSSGGTFSSLPPNVPDDFVKGVAKSATAMYKKWMDCEGTDFPALVAFAAKFREVQSKEAATKKQVAEEEAKKQAEEAAAKKQDEEAAKMQSEAELKPAEEEQNAKAESVVGGPADGGSGVKRAFQDAEKKSGAGDLSKDDVEIGMTVLTVSGKDKAKTDNKRAKVTVVNSSSLWVEFLEGPACGEAWHARYRNVKRVPDGKSELQNIVDPAGALKRKAEETIQSPLEKQSKGTASSSADGGPAAVNAGIQKAMAIFAKSGTDTTND